MRADQKRGGVIALCGQNHGSGKRYESTCEVLLPGALVFDAVGERSALFELRDACVASRSAVHRLHDLRHTYAVNALKAGYREQVVAHQLGHANATMIRKVYGRYVPDEADYQSHSRAQATSRRTGGRK
jgi:integrase